jgi:hypothetical protein
MMTKKEIMIVLVAFCLTVTLFGIIPVGSQRTREYDAWYDVNDDGKIDLKDYYGVGLKYGTEGDPTKNVNVTNWPNWMAPASQKGNYTEEIVVFSTETTQSSVAAYVGGLYLNTTSKFVLKFNPIRPNFNITKAYLSMTAFSTISYYKGKLTSAQFWITVNDQTEYFPPTPTVTDYSTLTEILIPMSMTASIHQEINILQVVGQGTTPTGPWYSLQTYQIAVYIEYEYQA